MELSSCWQGPVGLYTDHLQTRKSAFAPSATAERDRTTAFDRWAVDPGEPTTVSIKRLPTTSRKRSLANNDLIMPVTSGSQSLLASLPTFMSVFGDGRRDGNSSIAASPAHSPSTSISQTAIRAQVVPYKKSFAYNAPRSPHVYRRDSSNTIQTESTESSPTTTISTVDSTLTESSPSSSPDSPNSFLPISSLTSSKIATPTSEDDNMLPSKFPSSPSPNRPGFNRSDSPNKKPRNTKNLSVNTIGANRPSSSSSLPRLASTGKTSTLPGHAFSAPASPSFVIPVLAPKRKPSNLGLSISTSENHIKPQPSRVGFDVVPQTPSFARMTNLRNLEGVGSLPLFSPIGAPEGGMRLPPLGGMTNTTGKIRPALNLSHHTSFDSNQSSPIVLQTLDHVPEETDHDLPLSREVKSPAYPQGPVCIYDPNVYLYLEPNDVEASKFDVVINVAQEVNNPFTAAAKGKGKEKVEPMKKDVGIQVDLTSGKMDYELSGSAADPPSAVSERSFQSAFEVMPSNNLESPDTPKPNKGGPEYIHMPWEHNTRVSLELMDLCELIDDRVKRGKRVLIHCQCGVSRSASLVIAYGLYKNPEMSDLEAYNAVKERSRWINPNMHFIFELHAFKQMLNEKNQKNLPTRRPGAGLVRTQTDSVVHPNTYPAEPYADEPSTAPLQERFQQRASVSSQPNRPASFRFSDMPSSAEITPGPSSAAPETAWSTEPSPAPWKESMGSNIFAFSPPPPRTAVPQQMEFDMMRIDPMPSVENQMSIPGSFPEPNMTLPPANRRDFQLASPSTLPPLRSQPSMPAGFSSLMSRRQAPRQLPLRTEFAPSAPSLRTLQMPIDSVMVDAVPETPSLLSPRAAEFTATPFHRTSAGDLAGSSFYEQALLSPRATERDPRSPPIKGEAPITRNIDDVL